MPETTPLIKAALNLRGGAGFDVYVVVIYIREYEKTHKGNTCTDEQKEFAALSCLPQSTKTNMLSVGLFRTA